MNDSTNRGPHRMPVAAPSGVGRRHKWSPDRRKGRLARAVSTLIALTGLLALIAGLQPATTYAQAGPCDPPVTNPIVCENSKPGNPATEWDVSGNGDPSIQGYATDISVNKGGTVQFKIKTDAHAYRLDIYRLGYYGGLGARKVATVQPSASLPQNQAACLTDEVTGLIDCGNWAVSASWAVPANAVSGIYIARPVRTDTDGASHIVFIVRDDSGHSDLLFQTSDTTWQAYNAYGGNSLYVGSPVGRAYKVSYNRPFATAGASPGSDASWLFNAEYPMVRWLEANGYDVSYSTGVDSDRRGAELLEHQVFLSVGHDEYWSGPQRANVEAARAAGVHLAFFSGNEVFWKTRWEPSIDGSGTAHRTLVSYKETHANAKVDPNPAWTGTWRDPRFSPPADGGRPENALTGQLFMVNGPADYHALKVPAADGKLRFWRNTSV
ncbi:MAG: N,N-dimethylformamidase beta subunit family domain-containing protein, partial [Chloroflexota bacterium]